jgi:hypothetical protein
MESIIVKVLRLVSIPPIVYALYRAAEHNLLDTLLKAFASWPHP